MISDRTQRILLVTGALLYAVLAITSLRLESATFDETKHLPAGYTFLALGDYRLDSDNPALARMVAAVPLLFAGVRMNPDDPAWREGQVWRFAHQFLYRWNDADRTLLLGRLMIVLLGVLLAVAVFCWARALGGPTAALFALLFCVLSPDVLAHGRLATTDLAVSLFFFLAVATFERLTDRPSWRRLVLAGVFLGCALAAKFSAVALLPILASLTLVTAFDTRPLFFTPRTPAPTEGTVEPGLRRRLFVLTGALAAMALIAWCVVWSVYRFRFAPSPIDAAAPVLDWGRLGPMQGMAGALLHLARDLHLLPEAYLYGFFDMLRRGQGHLGFLAGEVSAEGWWYYFPVTFLLKTPIPLILLLLVSLAGMRRSGGGWRAQAFLWLPVAIYTAGSMSRRIDIGNRHLLPIYPFLFVAAGRGAAALCSAAGGRIGRVAVAVLAAWYALGTARVHPHYLAYFNEFAGGPSGGYRYLVDSNLDWGQSLKELESYVEDNRVPRIRLSYFGSADPGYYRIPCDYLPGETRPVLQDFDLLVLPGDLVAVSATNLQGVYLRPALWPLMEKFRGMRPIAVIGYSIFVYRSDFLWMLPAETARQLGWLPQAIASYGKALAADPSSAEAHGNLGAALLFADRPREARGSFEAALRIEPRYFSRYPARLALYQSLLTAGGESP